MMELEAERKKQHRYEVNINILDDENSEAGKRVFKQKGYK